MSKLYHHDHRFAISAANVAEMRNLCSPQESTSWIGDCRLRIHILKGVPGKHVDVCLSDEPYRGFLPLAPDQPRHYLTVCDIGRKEGRFDGAVRWRITVRDMYSKLGWRGGMVEQIPRGALMLIEEPGCIICEAVWHGGFWEQEFPRLQYTISPGSDRQSILIEQAKSYYWFLLSRQGGQGWDDVRALASEWAVRPEVLAEQDVNNLNRSASRALYRLARDLGWVKMTLRQRQRLQMGGDSSQWHRQETIDALRGRFGMTSGCGQHTISAAHGDAIYMPGELCRQCHELRDDCECID